MRKNAPRKWLHAILDLLPVILIPVFMIYSHRHTIDNGSIQVPQNQVVDFNQLVRNGDFENTNNWTTDYNIDFSVQDNTATLKANTQFSSISSASISFNKQDVFYLKFDYQALDDLWYVYSFSTDYVFTKISLNSSNTSLSTILTIRHNAQSSIVFQYDGSSIDENSLTLLGNVQLFNLSQMFGSGNEPTIQEFEQMYTADYYDYTLSRKELIKGVSTITYDDTDIMSQSMYQLYNSVDKYFNMNNIFNMNAVYDWFVLNVFNGNAPIVMYVVWNIALYELVMDLMFLLYALFMWFVDWCKSLIERTYDVGRGK